MAETTVKLTREIFMPYFRITLENGSSEELEIEDTREWFRTHGADVDKVEKALDYVWNFGSHKPVFLKIRNYVDPSLINRDNTTPIL